MPHYRTSAIVLAGLLLAACTPRDLVLGAGTTIGTAAMQERGLRGASQDYSLRLRINDAWFQSSLTLYERVSLLISRGRIVLIGRVPDETLRAQAEQLAMQAAGRTVINRITVGPDIPLRRRLEDDASSARLDGTFTLDRDVSAINYDVETRDGVVYLIGEARSESESRRVLYLAGQLPGIRSVETFIALPQQGAESN